LDAAQVIEHRILLVQPAPPEMALSVGLSEMPVTRAHRVERVVMTSGYARTGPPSLGATTTEKNVDRDLQVMHAGVSLGVAIAPTQVVTDDRVLLETVARRVPTPTATNVRVPLETAARRALTQVVMDDRVLLETVARRVPTPTAMSAHAIRARGLVVANEPSKATGTRIVVRVSRLAQHDRALPPGLGQPGRIPARLVR
jgi:hypothetical protein